MVGGEHELQLVWGFLLFIFGFWKSVCPQSAVEYKRENYIFAEVGEEEEEERMCCSAAVWSGVSHPQSFARHPTERRPAPLFWQIPKPHPCGLWSSGRGGFPRLQSISAALYIGFHPLWN